MLGFIPDINNVRSLTFSTIKLTIPVLGDLLSIFLIEYTYSVRRETPTNKSGKFMKGMGLLRVSE